MKFKGWLKPFEGAGKEDKEKMQGAEWQESMSEEEGMESKNYAK